MCSSLTSATIPNSIVSIGDSGFAHCTDLTSITIPDSVANMGDNVFTYCTSLTNVMIGKSVNSIGNGAFYGCSSLTSITIPNSVVSIGDYAFFGCSKLASITIPSSVTSIGYFTFGLCTSLTSVTIGNRVASIGDCAFANCYNLMAVYFQGDMPSVNGGPNSNTSIFAADYNATLYYLQGTSGWGARFCGLPAFLWNPQAQMGDGSFGVQSNQFGFNITGTSGLVIVVEACSNVSNPDWQPVQTNTLTGGTSYFSDPQWTNYPGRFYRLRSP